MPIAAIASSIFPIGKNDLGYTIFSTLKSIKIIYCVCASDKYLFKSLKKELPDIICRDFHRRNIDLVVRERVKRLKSSTRNARVANAFVAPPMKIYTASERAVVRRRSFAGPLARLFCLVAPRAALRHRCDEQNVSSSKKKKQKFFGGARTHNQNIIIFFLFFFKEGKKNS